MSVVTVAIPMHCVHSHAQSAIESIRRQTITELDIVLVVNGPDVELRRFAQIQANRDSRIRVLEIERRGLASALNAALRECSSEFLARMDDDDISCPDRLERQIARMSAQPDLAMVGCAYERIDERGDLLETVHVPTEPGDIRWRLLLGNVFAHGSVVMRPDIVREIGGYDESLPRAQDYDLWLRLSRHSKLANVRDVLYQHRVYARNADSVEDQQHRIAAESMLAAWVRLERDWDTDTLAAVREVLAKTSSTFDPADAIGSLESELTERGPSVERLLAWFWAKREAGVGQQRAVEIARRALLRERGRELRSDGVRSLWLWGAGAHTHWLLDHVAELGLDIAGIVDDRCAGQIRIGMRINSPRELQSGDHVLLSSDWREDELWRASADARLRGVHVHRLYSARGSHAAAGAA